MLRASGRAKSLGRKICKLNEIFETIAGKEFMRLEFILC